MKEVFVDVIFYLSITWTALWFGLFGLSQWQKWKAKSREVEQIALEARTKEAEKLADRMTVDRPGTFIATASGAVLWHIIPSMIYDPTQDKALQSEIERLMEGTK